MWAGGERLVRELMRILGNTVQEIVTMARLAFGAAGAAAGGGSRWSSRWSSQGDGES